MREREGKRRRIKGEKGGVVDAVNVIEGKEKESDAGGGGSSKE